MEETGLHTSVFVDGAQARPEPDGYGGQLTSHECQLVVHVVEEQKDSVFAFMGREGERVALCREEERAEDMGGKVYAVTVPLKKTMSVFHPVYPANTLRVVEMLGDGRTIIRRVVLTSQRGLFFAVKDIMHDVRCYLDPNESALAIVCPALHERWPQMEELLSTLWVQRYGFAGTLPIESDYQPDPKPSTEGLTSPNMCRVLWWSFGMGMGAQGSGAGALLRADGEVVRASWEEVPPRPRLRYLRPGEIVKAKGFEKPESKRGTDFEYEAIGISLVEQES